MDNQPQTLLGHRGPSDSGRSIGMAIAAVLVAGLAASALAQNDDPDNLTVPEGLQRVTENPLPQNDNADPEAPRVRIGDEARRERIVGEVISIDGNTLTIMHEKRKRAIQVPQTVDVTRDGKPVPLRQLQPGDVVRIERGVAPDSVTGIVAATPAPSGDRDPDPQLRSQRRKAAEQEPLPDVVQSQVPGQGGRVWVVLVEPDSEVARSGLRPGDVIVVTSRGMLQGEGALQGLASGLFPLRADAEGQVVISPNAAGVSVLGPAGAAVPTGVNIGAENIGATFDPRPNAANPDAAVPPRTSVGDQNFGPPIGRRQDPADRNYGPQIGTGNDSTPQTPGAGQQPPQPPPAP